jgi:hypothetical protein
MLFALEETKFESNIIFGQREHTSAPKHARSNEEKHKNTELHQVPSAISTGLESGIDHAIPKRSYSERHAFFTPTRKTTTSCWKRFARQTYQPFYILVLFPAVMFSALQYAWSESMLSFLAVTQATLYPLPPYNFSAIGIGNMNIPPAIGAIIGSIFGGPFSDYLILVIAKRRGGIFEPEYRLWTFMVPGLAMVAGVLMYGLTISEVREREAILKPVVSRADIEFIGHAVDHQLHRCWSRWLCTWRLGRHRFDLRARLLRRRK